MLCGDGITWIENRAVGNCSEHGQVFQGHMVRVFIIWENHIPTKHEHIIIRNPPSTPSIIFEKLLLLLIQSTLYYSKVLQGSTLAVIYISIFLESSLKYSRLDYQMIFQIRFQLAGHTVVVVVLFKLIQCSFFFSECHWLESALSSLWSCVPLFLRAS